MAVLVPPPMSSAASGSRSFEVACVVGVVSWDGRGNGDGHVCALVDRAGVGGGLRGGWLGLVGLKELPDMFPMTAPRNALSGWRGAFGMCGGKWGSRRTGFNNSPPQRQAPPPHAPIFAIASGPGFHGERHGVIQWPVHHLQLRHDQPHPPYLALCPPLVAADRPKNPAKLIEEGSEGLQESRRRDCPGERLPGPEKICRPKPMSLREVLGVELAGTCGFPRVEGGQSSGSSQGIFGPSVLARWLAKISPWVPCCRCDGRADLVQLR